MNEPTREDYALEVINLRHLVRRLRDAMRKSEDVGCTDHLDCWPEAGEVWYAPLDEATKVLGE